MGKNRNISKVPGTVQGLEILPYLLTNEHFLDADKRHETPGLETKNSITHSKSGSELHSYLLQIPMLPSFMRAMLMMDACKQNGLHLEDRNAKLGESPLLQKADVSQPCFW